MTLADLVRPTSRGPLTHSLSLASENVPLPLSAPLTTCTYDAANQLQTAQNASGVTTYTFDPNGNQQVVVEPTANRTTWTWDYENQPTLVQLPTGVRVTMAYHADNRRVKKET